MAKKNAPTSDFVVLDTPSAVEVWSTKRLPFEPKGWLIDLRDKIRSGLSTLTIGSNEFLQAVIFLQSKRHAMPKTYSFTISEPTTSQQNSKELDLKEHFLFHPRRPND
jgi:hypothetical protein